MNFTNQIKSLKTYRLVFVFISLSLLSLSYVYGQVDNVGFSVLSMGIVQIFHLIMINCIINDDEVIYTPRGITANAGSGTKVAIVIGFVGHYFGILMIFVYVAGSFQ